MHYESLRRAKCQGTLPKRGSPSVVNNNANISVLDNIGNRCDVLKLEVPGRRCFKIDHPGLGSARAFTKASADEALTKEALTSQAFSGSQP